MSTYFGAPEMLVADLFLGLKVPEDWSEMQTSGSHFFQNFPFKAAKKLRKKMQLTLGEFAKIWHISPEIYRSESTQNQNISAEKAELLFAIASAFADMVAVLGDYDEAAKKLKSRILKLDRKRPLDLIDSEKGRDQIRLWLNSE